MKRIFKKLAPSKIQKQQKFKYLFFVICSLLFLNACSSSLPDKRREISDFVPQKKVVEENPANFNWVQDNFPQNCRWEKFDRVVDGDTIYTTEHKVRLIGINTPEVRSPYTEEQPGGPEATAKIREILTNVDEVCLIHDSIGDKTDRYGRTLAYVFLKDGTDINAKMLKTGFARWYSRFSYERKGEFQEYENSAKKAGVGVWEGFIII